MKKITKKLFILLTMVVLCFAVAMTASAEGVITGKCGEDAYWSFDESTGRVVISGTGAVSYDYSTSPEDLYFYHDKIETLTVEEGITELAYDSFQNCPNLINLTLPESLRIIGSQAFMNSYDLEINIPAGVEEIGNYAFMLTKSITVDEGNKYYSSDGKGVLFNKEKTELIMLPSCSEITEYDVPEGIVRIHNSAQYSQNLTKISFPSSLKIIDGGFLALSAKLKTVEFSEGLESIGEYSFTSCLSIESVELPLTLKSIGQYAFGECNSLKKIIVKSPHIEIGELSLGLTMCGPKDISHSDWVVMAQEVLASVFDNDDEAIKLQEKYNSHTEYYDEPREINGAVIYVHDDEIKYSVEDYATSNNIVFERRHFYSEWIYDYDNMIRYRECYFKNCDELETEQLETTTEGDVEIIEPTNPDTDFTVDVVTDYVIIEEALTNNVEGDWGIVKAFDINLKNKDGVHVQPNGTVKVKLPLDWSKDGVYKVYRVNDDGTLTDMNAYRQGSHMVFDTDHFSIYVIVDESEKADEPVIPDEPQEETKDDFFLKLLDFINALIDLLISIFK